MGIYEISLATMGLAMTHQIVRPFKSMTLLENVTLGAGCCRIRNVFRVMTSFDREAEQIRAMESRNC